MIKRHKDRRHLRATMRLPVSHVRDRKASGVDDGSRGHYYRVYLWATAEAARAATGTADGQGLGWHCATAWMEGTNGDGVVVKRKPAGPMLGELHFVAGHWSMEVAAHELRHLDLHLERLWPGVAHAAIEQSPMAAEELICYRFGRMLETVYRWLWEQDPGTWTKST